MTRRPAPDRPPGLTACALCVGESLGENDPYAGGQLARLREVAARGCARLTEVERLDQCNRGDVVVVRPDPAGRRRGVRPFWMSGLAGEELTAALEAWLARGGPGRADVPAALRALQVDRDDPTRVSSRPPPERVRRGQRMSTPGSCGTSRSVTASNTRPIAAKSSSPARSTR
jgi:hypothetical protein